MGLKGEVFKSLTPELYEKACTALQRLRESETKYEYLDRTNLRGLGFQQKFSFECEDPFGRYYTDYFPKELPEGEEVYSFLLDPIKFNLGAGEYLGLNEENSNSQGGADILLFQRKFWIYRIESSWEKVTKRHLFKENETENVHFAGLNMDSPVYPTESDTCKTLIIGEKYVRREKVQFDVPQVEIVPADRLVIPLYQKNLDDLIEIYDQTEHKV